MSEDKVQYGDPKPIYTSLIINSDLSGEAAVWAAAEARGMAPMELHVHPANEKIGQFIIDNGARFVNCKLVLDPTLRENEWYLCAYGQKVGSKGA